MNNRSYQFRKTAVFLSLCSLAVMLTGCWAKVSTPDSSRLVGGSFFEEQAASANAGTTQVIEKWWTCFGDKQLNELMASAELDNLSIQQAWFKLIQSRQQAKGDKAGQIPTLSNSGNAGRNFNKNGGSDWAYSTDLALGLSANYEVDLWGRVHSQAQAARLDAIATEHDLRAAALTVAADICTNWFTLVELYGQLDITNQQIETNTQELEVITSQFRSGQVNASNVLQQRQLLEASKGERITTLASIASTKNALAVLVGRDPARFDITPEKFTLPELDSPPATGVPGEVLNRRPDIASALVAVSAADYRLAGAIADRLPKLSLSASVSTNSEKVHDLFENWLANLAANIAAPIVDGGKLKSEVRRKRAVAAEKFAVYHEKILTAVKEVRNAASNENSQNQYIENISKQLELAAQSLSQIKQQYLNGSDNFTALLSSRKSYQNLQKQQLAAQKQLIEYRISLYKSLSGGWITPQPQLQTDRVHGPLAGLFDAKNNQTQIKTTSTGGDKK